MPRRSDPNNKTEWLSRARSALRTARLAGKPGTAWEDFCFHCQQAAEKAIKAVYVARGLRFAYVHDLEFLLRGLTKRGVVIPENVLETTFLSRYASETRYPGRYERVSKQDHAKAVRAAKSVIDWATKELNH